MKLPRPAVTARLFPILLLAAALAGLPSALPGQTNGADARSELQARIDELQDRLVRAEGDEAARIRLQINQLRTRLTEGDFRAGDAIILVVFGEETLSDTFVVEPPRQLRLPGVDPIDMTGVLRNELEPHLKEQLGRFLRNPEVRATSLMRVAVLGAVNRPGYYLMPPSTPVSEVFSPAGGFVNNAKLRDIRVERLGDKVVDKQTFRQAMAAGWNLRQLDIQAGDEVVVPQASSMRPREWVFVASGVLGITVTLLRLFDAF